MFKSAAIKLFPFLIGYILLLFSCTGKGKDNTLFTLLDSKETGINFNNISVENEQINILTYEYMYNGGGVAIGDINNDGLKDIYFTSNNLENKLYLNKGNMKFEDITAKAGAGCKEGWKTGVTMADVNGDGLIDIYVCKSADGNAEKRRNILLINNGDLTFTNKAKEYGYSYGGEIAGHIVGEYPHEQPADPKSFDLDVHPSNHNDMFLRDANGNERHWILEMHFVDKENNCAYANNPIQ